MVQTSYPLSIIIGHGDPTEAEVASLNEGTIILDLDGWVKTIDSSGVLAKVASLNGEATRKYFVGDPTDPYHAINKKTLDAIVGNIEQSQEDAAAAAKHDLDTGIASVAGTIAQLRLDMEACCTSVKARITKNEGDISTNKTKINTNKNDITSLKARVTKNEGDISTNKAKINTNKNDITNLKPRVAKNESDITNLKNNKVDKIAGKGLSSNDFTDPLLSKLNGIAAHAEVNVQADWSETNPSKDSFIKNKPPAGGTSSKSTNGWHKTAEGIIYQWGKAGIKPCPQYTTILFPIAFPTKCFQVMTTKDSELHYDGGSGGLMADQITKAGFRTTQFRENDGVIKNVHYFAIGY